MPGSMRIATRSGLEQAENQGDEIDARADQQHESGPRRDAQRTKSAGDPVAIFVELAKRDLPVEPAGDGAVAGRPHPWPLFRLRASGTEKGGLSHEQAGGVGKQAVCCLPTRGAWWALLGVAQRLDHGRGVRPGLGHHGGAAGRRSLAYP